MTITKDTDLSEILSSDSVIDEMSTFTGNIQGLINDRTSTLQTEMASGNGISETQLVDGEPLFYTKGTEVSSEYGNISESATNLNKSICAAAIEKERDELTELRICLLKDNQEIQDRIAAYEAEYQEKVAEVKKVISLKQNTYDGIAMAAAPWGGIFTPIGRRVFVLADLKEDYYGESGVIKLEEKKFNANNEKIISINYRMTQLKASYSNYSNDELDTRYHYKPRYQGGNDCDNTTDGGGNTTSVPKTGNDTSTDTASTPETANPTDATEATNSGTDTSTDTASTPETANPTDATEATDGGTDTADTTNSGVDADLLSKDIKI